MINKIIGGTFFIIGLLLAGADTKWADHIQFIFNFSGAVIVYLSMLLIQKERN